MSISQQQKVYKSHVTIEALRKQYRSLKVIGKGAFALVHKVQDLQTQKNYALKIQNQQSEAEKEIVILNSIKSTLHCKGLVKMRYAAKLDDHKCFIVMKEYGESLLSARQSQPRRYNNQIIRSIFVQMVQILKEFHSLGWIHGDIKPNNILLHKNVVLNELDQDLQKVDKLNICLIDYGLCQPIEKAYNARVEVLKEANGNIHFMSRNQLQFKKLTEKDDLESLVYTLLYLLNGDLPWGVETNEGSDKTIARKMELNVHSLTNNLHRSLKNAIEYVFKLNSGETPNYEYLVELLRDQKTTVSFQSYKPQQSTSDIDNSEISRDGGKAKKEEVYSLNFHINLKKQIEYACSIDKSQVSEVDQTPMTMKNDKFDSLINDLSNKNGISNVFSFGKQDFKPIDQQDESELQLDETDELTFDLEESYIRQYTHITKDMHLELI